MTAYCRTQAVAHIPDDSLTNFTTSPPDWTSRDLAIEFCQSTMNVVIIQTTIGRLPDSHPSLRHLYLALAGERDYQSALRVLIEQRLP